MESKRKSDRREKRKRSQHRQMRACAVIRFTLWRFLSQLHSLPDKSQWKPHACVLSRPTPKEREGGKAEEKESQHQKISGGLLEDRRSAGFAMLTKRNGACVNCVPPGKDGSDQVDVTDCTCSIGECSWDCLAGVNGCLSDTSCLWFQLLARAYWGDVELGLREAQKGVSWRRPRKTSPRNCMRSWVRFSGRGMEVFGSWWCIELRRAEGGEETDLRNALCVIHVQGGCSSLVLTQHLAYFSQRDRHACTCVVLRFSYCSSISSSPKEGPLDWAVGNRWRVTVKWNICLKVRFWGVELLCFYVWKSMCFRKRERSVCSQRVPLWLENDSQLP